MSCHLLLVKGRARAFAKELVQWALSSKVAALGVVAGCDDMLRHDPNMMRLVAGAIASIPLLLAYQLSCVA